MKKRFVLLLVIAGIVQSCSSGSSDQPKQIDYSNLDTLQTAVTLEIGESEDYIPGRLRDLQVTSDGEIIASDWGVVSLEQFDASGQHVATIAEQGSGPGELQNYFQLQHIVHDTLIVRQQSKNKDFFAPDEDGIYSYVRTLNVSALPERNFTVIGIQSDTTYYATSEYIRSGMPEEDVNKEDYRTNFLVSLDRELNVTQDSIQPLKTAKPHVVSSGSMIMRRAIPYRFDDKIAVLDDGAYLIARPDSNAIYLFNREHELRKTIPLNVSPRKISDEDLDHYLGNGGGKLRAALEDRIRKTKPPYLEMWATDTYIWLLTDESEEGKEMVVLNFEGQPQGRLMLPQVDQIGEVRENKIYTIHRSPERGDLIRAYNVDV